MWGYDEDRPEPPRTDMSCSPTGQRQRHAKVFILGT
jgi:hypothetical protein